MCAFHSRRETIALGGIAVLPMLSIEASVLNAVVFQASALNDGTQSEVRLARARSSSKISPVVLTLHPLSRVWLQPASRLGPLLKQPLAKAPQLRMLQRLGTDANLERMRRASAGRSLKRQREPRCLNRLAQQDNAGKGKPALAMTASIADAMR